MVPCKVDRKIPLHPPILKNQMEKKMEHEMETRGISPLKWIESGIGYIIKRSPYTPYSIYLRGSTTP